MSPAKRRTANGRVAVSTAPEKRAYAMASNPVAVKMAIKRIQDDAIDRGLLILRPQGEVSQADKALLATQVLVRAAERVSRLSSILGKA